MTVRAGVKERVAAVDRSAIPRANARFPLVARRFLNQNSFLPRLFAERGKRQDSDFGGEKRRSINRTLVPRDKGKEEEEEVGECAVRSVVRALRPTPRMTFRVACSTLSRRLVRRPPRVLYMYSLCFNKKKIIAPPFPNIPLLALLPPYDKQMCISVFRLGLPKVQGTAIGTNCTPYIYIYRGGGGTIHLTLQML